MLVLVYLRMSRSGKRKDGWDPSELTTEEGLLEVVSTRQIWRKINYDASRKMVVFLFVGRSLGRIFPKECRTKPTSSRPRPHEH